VGEGGVGVFVGVAVGVYVFVGVGVGVFEGVRVGVFEGLGVFVGVFDDFRVGVALGVFVGGMSSVGSGVSVGSSDCFVAVGDGVLVGSTVPVASVGVEDTVSVGVGLAVGDWIGSDVSVAVGLKPPDAPPVAVGTGKLASSSRSEFAPLSSNSPLSRRASAMMERCRDPIPLPKRSIP
jgi:hypothetical protein